MTDMLQPSDRAALASHEKKMHLVRDHVTAVARGFKTGYYLYGTGGSGKSFTVLRHLEISDAELTALMRDLAGKGHRVQDKLVISPEECMKVTEYLLKECRSAGCPLDLRLQQKAFQTYLQFTGDCSVSHWEDLISASVRE